MINLFEVVYLDNHILVVDKAACVPTQVSKLHVYSLQEACKEFLKNKFDKPGSVFCEPIHRLDKDVSGLVVFARTSKALSRLNESMRNQEIKKTYLAKVEGVISENTGKLSHFLEKKDYHAKICKQTSHKAKLAKLNFVKVESDSFVTRLRVELETGRYHQIRAQFSHIGHPIVGDKKYGSQIEEKEGIALQHVQVSFPHPVTKQLLTFKIDSRI